MKSIRYSLLLLMLSSLTACKRDDAVRVPLSVNTDPKVRTIKWKELQIEAQLRYNTDQTLQRMIYRRNGTAINETVFTYDPEKRLVELANSTLAAKQLFRYNGAGKLTRQEFVLKDGGTYHARKCLDYTYSVAGRLKQLDYFIVNETGSTLQQSNRYTYDSDGRLLKITIEDRNKNQQVISLDSYSPAVQFDPLYLIFQEFDENYAVYNLALLQQLRKLPARIRRYQLISGVLKPIKSHRLDHQIDAGRLKKQLTTTVSINPTATVIELTGDYRYE